MKTSLHLFLLCALISISTAFVLGSASKAPLTTHRLISKNLKEIPLSLNKNENYLEKIRLTQNNAAASIVAAAPAEAAAVTGVIYKASIKAIATLMSTCGIGVVAGKIGILDQTALGVLSKLVFYIFQPCFLFSNVARTVANLQSGASKSNMAALYILPISAFVQIMLGFVVGKVVSLLIYKGKGDCEGAKQLQACTTFGNSGPLPLVFTHALFHANPDITLATRSATYISLYLLGWSPLFWIIGPEILKEKGKEDGLSKQEKTKALLKRIFSPPVVGSLLGMAVGFIPFMRKVLLTNDGLLNPFYEAIRTLGTGYLPAVLLVLAGSLAPPKAAPGVTTVTENKVDMVWKVAAIYLSRYFIMPMVAFLMYGLSIKHVPGALQLFKTDRLLLFILLLEACMPSAQNTTVILQLLGDKAAATRLAQTLMMIYILGVPAISYWLVQILQLTKLAG